MSSRKEGEMVHCGLWHWEKVDWTGSDHKQDHGTNQRWHNESHHRSHDGLYDRSHHRPKKVLKKIKNIYICIIVFKIKINENRIEKLKYVNLN